MLQAGNLVKNLIRDFHEKLAGIYPEQEIRQILYMLFDEYLGWTKTRVHLSLDAEIHEPEMNSFKLALGELVTGKPIQYILRKAWFNETLLKVGPGVLVPRPETEELCSIIQADHHEQQDQHFSILDVGTGSGCIAIDLKKKFPFSSVTAIDNSIQALEIAVENAFSNNCDVIFMHVDILNQSQWKAMGKYNLVVSNPPYIAESEKRQLHRNVIGFEPANALFVSDDDPLIFYRAICGFACTHLISTGSLYFEINERFGREVCELLVSFGFENVKILKDFHDRERFTSAKFKSR